MQEQTTTRALTRVSFDTIAVWALAATAALATIAVIPLAAYPVLATKATILALGALIVLMLYIVARLTQGSIIVPPLHLIGALWLVPLAYTLSTFFSGANVSRSFFGINFEVDTLGFMLILALLATVSALALRKAAHYRMVFQTLAGALGILLVAQVGFIIAAKVFPNTISATATLIGSFADLGQISGLGVVLILVASRFLSFGSRTKIALTVLAVLALCVVALQNSLLVWVLIALFSGALFIEAVMRRGQGGHDGDLEGVSLLSSEGAPGMDQASRSVAIPLVVLIVSAFFIVGGSSFASSLAGNLGINVIDVRPSWASTLEVGSHTYTSSPIFGSGPGTFTEEWLKFRDRSLNDTLFWNVDFTSGIGHIPSSFVTTGVVGALAWLIFIGFFLYSGMRMFLFRMPESPFLQFASLGAFAGGLYVLSLAAFAAPGPVVLAAGFLFVGIFVSTLRHAGKGHEWGIVFAKAPRLGFAIVFGLTLLLLASVAAGYVVLERYLGTVAYTEASNALSGGNIGEAEKAATRALALAPTDQVYRLAATIGVARMNQIVNDATLSPAAAQEQFQTTLSNAIAAAIKATEVAPGNYQNALTLGGVYQAVTPLKIAGAYEAAMAAYERAVALNPSSPELPYAVAQLEIGQEKFVSAETKLLEAVTLKRDYIPAILLLAQLEIRLGKAAEALQAAEAAAYFAPNDSAVLFQVGLLRSGIGDYDGAVAALERATQFNPQYANARYFLAAIEAYRGDSAKALAELRAVGALSEANAAVVAADIAALESGKNPFSLEKLRTLGIPQPPVSEVTPDAAN